MRFDLVDSILEQDSTHIVTVKNVTAAEEYLADHFPSFPVLPGVMMLECLVQAGRRLLRAVAAEVPGPWVLAEVRNVRYGNMVRPGQRLRLHVEILKHEDSTYTLQGKGTVDDQPAVQGRFVLRPLRKPQPATDAAAARAAV